MKNTQTRLHKFLLIFSTTLIPASAAASAETENIWLYVFLIPVYFILALQCLLVILALVMKQFKTKQTVLISSLVASILMLLSLGLNFYYNSLEGIWTLLLYFSLIGIIVSILPIIQFKLMFKPDNSSNEN